MNGWKIRALAWVLLTLIAVDPVQVRAWEDTPEFISLAEGEPEIFEGPGQLGSEYQSDLFSYMKPETWQYDWITRDRLLDLSIGSLNATQFLMDTRLKIRAPLGEHSEFRFHFLDDRDLEKQSVHHILEFILRPKPWLGVSLYGDPDFSKRRNDTGVALVLNPSERHEIRLFNTFVDVTRLRRSDRPDTFVEPDLPYSRGVVGRLWSSPAGNSRDFFQYALRFDTRTRWLFPQDELIYGYRKTLGSVFFSSAQSSTLRWSGRAQYDEKSESRTPDGGTSSVTASGWRTRRFISHLRATISELGPRQNWGLDLGLMAALRSWNTTEGDARSRDLLPLVALHLPGYESARRRDRWSVGVIETVHQSSGDPALFSGGAAASESEFRLSVTYDFVFGADAVLRLQANADLDEFGKRGAWEGGNGQFLLRF